MELELVVLVLGGRVEKLILKVAGYYYSH